MRILFTGSSSFTGFWFIKSLKEAGHDVTAVFQKQPKDYQGIRGERVQELVQNCQPVFGCSFGDKRFIELIETGEGWDIFCHHAADVTNYKSLDFDYTAALANNTHSINQILKIFKKRGLKGIILTGSVFEASEGAGTDGLRAFSPYGLSKTLTHEVFKYFCQIHEIKLGKFVIPNPFGPYEEPRFTNYLVASWFKGDTPLVKTPNYIRDNIHISLLGKIYAKFISGTETSGKYRKINPCGYIETQGEFAKRFSREMSSRLRLPCEVMNGVQTEFLEPLVRINTEIIDPIQFSWNESNAWDELALFYKKLYG